LFETTPMSANVRFGRRSLFDVSELRLRPLVVD
jgi:hypothetical protein